MGEIKSTLDIVMEKTKHLTLSQEERVQQTNDEIDKKLKGMLQKYLDRMLKKGQLEKELDRLESTYGTTVKQVFKNRLLNGIKFDHDNEPLLLLLRELYEVDVRAFEALFSDYQNSVGSVVRERMKKIEGRLYEKHHISGSAVVPNLETDNESILAVAEVKSKFDALLKQELDMCKPNLF